MSEVPVRELNQNTAGVLAAHAVFGSKLTSFVSYDKRLLGAAEALGLPVASPGA